MKVDGYRPITRTSHSAILYNEKMVVFGGLAKHNCNDVHAFHFERRHVKPNVMSRDFLSLLGDTELSDVSFNVNGKVFYAHKCILVARSAHFKALLTGGMRESSQNVITMDGISPEVFEVVLTFLYSNTLTQTDGNMLEVLIASDRYLLGELKLLTEDVLLRAVNVDNARTLYNAAFDVSANRLIAKCKKMLGKNTAKRTKKEIKKRKHPTTLPVKKSPSW
mmetsp:Transcript_29680/g.33081  ORF Transcript_29680/g.33081 Transcript_29680/m.33081 type:complete len:221 (-) Transcript_29680:148-810(-)